MHPPRCSPRTLRGPSKSLQNKTFWMVPEFLTGDQGLRGLGHVEQLQCPITGPTPRTRSCSMGTGRRARTTSASAPTCTSRTSTTTSRNSPAELEPLPASFDSAETRLVSGRRPQRQRFQLVRVVAARLSTGRRQDLAVRRERLLHADEAAELLRARPLERQPEAHAVVRHSLRDLPVPDARDSWAGAIRLRQQQDLGLRRR